MKIEYPSLAEITEARSRQRLRGLMAKGSTQRGIVETMNHLRRDLSEADAPIVASMIFCHPLLSNLELTDDFPEVPPQLYNLIRMAEMPLYHELVFLSERLRRNEARILRAIKVLGQANDAIASRNPGRIGTMLGRFKAEGGYSLAYLRKIAFIHYATEEKSGLWQRSLEELRLYGLQKRQILPLAITDLMEPDYDYFLTRSSILEFADKEGHKFRTAADALRYLFRPVRLSSTDIASQLHTHGLFSLLDAVLFAVGHHLLPEANEALRVHLPLLVSPEVIGAVRALDRGAERLHRALPTVAPGLSLDRTFYRSSIAFAEVPRLASYRDALDSYYGDPLDGFGVLPSSKAADAYFGQPTAIIELVGQSNSVVVNIDRFIAASAGPLVRTIAVIRSIRAGASAADLTEDELIALMANTSELSRLLAEDEIRSFFRYASDPMSEYIMLSLVSERTGKSAHKHAQRRVLQSIVEQRFDGDLIAFAEWLFKRGPGVAEHLFDLCTEALLVQLYHLLPTTDEVYETRAKLLDWYAERFDEPLANDRAKTLRLDKRLQRVRGQINDVRIYVDHVRFTSWLQDNTIDEISVVFRGPEITEEEVLSYTGEGGYPASSTSAGRLASLLQKAFEEFCADKRYGVDSYIGRRIRHGTLYGYLATQMEPLLERSEYQDLSVGESGRRLQAWLADYRANVTQLGQDMLQVRSKKKPRGLLNPGIGGARKIGFTREAIRDIARQYKETKSIAVVHQNIIEHCWRILEQDLRVVRDHLDTFRRTHATFPISLFERGLPEQAKPMARALGREINRFTEERFRSVSSWFTKPTNLSPSAPFSLLFEAVMDEVQEHFPDFEPTIEQIGLQDIDVFGVLYHHVYDFLYVVIYNAAKHGHRCGLLSNKIVTEQSDLIINSIVISVSSDLHPGDTDADVLARIEEALAGDLEDAMVVENRSGIKKLRRMEADVREIEKVDWGIEDRRITFSCHIRSVHLNDQ
ncbi:MAG: hypothetical protein KJ944_21355 [Alphaproteobacteria bacterium]|nr:hypothetical protein [Alphaproteobacteria bacterium]MBU1559760.1 hypothetical protein [Alphaproteobacteria bacterium]MBU2305139.1 hypothetical protein [Alphaproteobacteria bacterium]MBU2367944.1 hypothetical protein [Alphaproteobacteria bacterium]